MKSTGITIWKDTEALSIAAAHFFVADCHRCIAKKGKFIVALSGGNTPKRLYQLLASPEFSRNIPWDKVFLFWSDERFVPHTDADSNYHMVKENLLAHISIPEKNIFLIPVDGTPKDCAKEYEKSITQFFKNKKVVFDWLLLGLGDDGHTASLFPGTAILKEKKRLIKEVWVEEKQTWRISFTLPLINRAAQIIFLIAGKEKAAVVVDVINHKKIKPTYPSQLVKPEKGTIYWMLDEEAAAKV
jgi:6-phosphogluconolactonase